VSRWPGHGLGRSERPEVGSSLDGVPPREARRTPRQRPEPHQRLRHKGRECRAVRSGRIETELPPDRLAEGRARRTSGEGLLDLRTTSTLANARPGTCPNACRPFSGSRRTSVRTRTRRLPWRGPENAEASSAARPPGSATHPRQLARPRPRAAVYLLARRCRSRRFLVCDSHAVEGPAPILQRLAIREAGPVRGVTRRSGGDACGSPKNGYAKHQGSDDRSGALGPRSLPSPLFG
jgi:hypothetical protein